MRCFLAFAVVLLLAGSGCSERDAPRPGVIDSKTSEQTSGETRHTITPRGESQVVSRSGPRVPVTLPAGFTLYPGAQVIANTIVERDGNERILVVFETTGQIADVMAFYRRQVAEAGGTFKLDVGGETRASLGGTLAQGGSFAISVRQGATTRVEIAFE